MPGEKSIYNEIAGAMYIFFCECVEVKRVQSF
jgi:hypothetical protein